MKPAARACLLLLLAPTGCGEAGHAVDTATTQVQAVAQAASSPSLSTGDAAFMDTAAHAGIEAGAFAQLARTQARRDDVRTLALQQIDTFTQLDQALDRLAAVKHVTLPLDMDLAHQQSYAALQPLQGRAFDRAYLDDQAADASTLLVALRTEAAQGTDPDVRSLARRYAALLATRQRAVARLGGRAATAP